jgi:hypothetical protein
MAKPAVSPISVYSSHPKRTKRGRMIMLTPQETVYPANPIGDECS